mgnify:CR=1 FL=1|jgi:uncharacterized protein YabN with tetrapyrrole methylase and pyrophosphatase domain
MSKSFDELYKLLLLLRTECEWDKEQTLGSLAKHIIEEAHEVVHAISEYENESSPENLKELESELGDLLIQPLLESLIASESTELTIESVIQTVTEKLIRRHPHVFDKSLPQDMSSLEKQWSQIKETEKNEVTPESSVSESKSPLAEYHHLPAFTMARKTIKHFETYKDQTIESNGDKIDINSGNMHIKLLEITKWAKENNVDLEYELIAALKNCK